MALEVVDGDKRLAGRERDRLRRGQADQHAADQPRAGGRGDRVDLAKADAGLAHRGRDHGVERLDMGAGGNLGTTPP